MSRPTKVEQATAEDCDWRWTEDMALMRVFESAVQTWARRYGLDRDELHGEAMLFIAVRPGRGNTPRLIFTHVGKCAQTMRERLDREPPIFLINEEIL